MNKFLDNRFGKLFFTCLTGLLLSFAWPTSELAPLLFIGFVPLLFVLDKICEDNRKRKGLRHFGTVYLALLIWNVGTTWWVYYSSDWGAIAAFVFNTLFMSIIFHFSYFTRKRWGSLIGNISLIIFWVAFEYLHLSWELSWPWLTLGFGFATYTSWVQWYEYTGVLGGSIWVLTVNILIFRLIKHRLTDKSFQWKKRIAGILALIIIPIGLSSLIYYTYKEKSSPVNIVVVQPNFDPYHEKFNISDAEKLDMMLTLAAPMVDRTTDYIIFPETALPEAVWEDYLNETPNIKTIKEFIKPFPKLNFVCGMGSERKFNKGEKLSETARQSETNPDVYYDDYNASFQIDNSGKIQIYHKSKLVPGVEKMPYPKIFSFLGKYAIQLGGTSGSYGTQDDRTVFNSINGKWKIGTAICYESIYGDFLSGYLKNGADLLFIITNDGWWHDTPGYKQHCNYGRLTAIEFRRSIARSANTGISCFINQRGDMQQATKWWQPAVIKQSINANSEITFYAKHGDYLGKIAAVLSIGTLLFLVLGLFIKKK